MACLGHMGSPVVLTFLDRLRPQLRVFEALHLRSLVLLFGGLCRRLTEIA
jgi:hypothetical protein